MAKSLSIIEGVHVCSGRFASGADFPLFSAPSNKVPHRVSVFFGRNGSGKTTIAEQIYAIASGGNDEAWFYDRNNNHILLEDSERSRVRVFGERYVREKVGIAEDGVEAIVMLGEQVAAKKRLDEIDNGLRELAKEEDHWSSVKNSAENGASSLKRLEKLSKDVAKDGGWASRRAAIEGGANNLTQARWEAILEAKTNSSRQQLEDRFNKDLDNYKRIKGSDRFIEHRAPSVDSFVYDEKKLVALLNVTLDEPSLNDREKRILALAQRGDQQLIERARIEFATNQDTVCPMCQQVVTADYGESLEKSITKILSREADNYRRALSEARLRDIQADQDIPSQVTPAAKAAYFDSVFTANTLIKQYNDFLDGRMSNLYSPLFVEPLGLSKEISEVNNCVKKINSEIEGINEAVKNKEEFRKSLLELNDQIARIDASATIERYAKVKEQLSYAEKELKKIRKDIDALHDERNREEARMRQTKIAADTINRYLANVFFDSSRLRLVPSGGLYRVESYGKAVAPKDISTGEKNILGLCYFFSESGKGRFADTGDDDPQYLVLDDPVSSFDMENRVGICSLIRERAGNILLSNPDSKITVMTHDAAVVAELKHVFSDLQNQIKESCNFKTDYFEIRKDKTDLYQMKRGEYAVLLERAYCFASSQEEDVAESYIIGNVLRRILEGYSSFNYGIGMAELSRDTDLNKRFGGLATKIETAMYRLVLNDESHMQERLTAASPSILFERYSFEEKRALAQYVFVVLNKLDPDHVAKRLKAFNLTKKEINNNIENWESRFCDSPEERHS